MGAPMAERLVDAGHDVAVWTRSGQVSETLSNKARVYPSASEAVENSDVVIAVLASPEVLDDIVLSPAVQSALHKGAILVDMGTSGVSCAKRHAAAAHTVGYHFADAPVSGGVTGAERGTLTIFVGAEEDVFKRLAPVLSAMGTPHHLGQAGAGQAAKLANQIIVAVNISALSEAMVFAERLGLDRSKLLATLEGGFADSTILRQHGPRMAAMDFSAGGAMSLHLKDLNLVQQSDAEAFDHLEHTALARKTFSGLVEAGHGQKDHSGYILGYQTE